jgi:FMN phosphatase YigB (HAD superfamily)
MRWDALLLDLDGTLLDLDGNEFLDAYCRVVADGMAPVADPSHFLEVLMSAAIPVMVDPHPGQRNRDVLWEALARSLEVPRDCLEAQYRDVLAGDLSRIAPGGGPRDGARELVTTARSLGLKLAIATMPIYPLAVVRERLRRGRLDTVPWDVVATDEFQAVKPHPDYFLELAKRLAVNPERCLVVGDDYFQDIPARRVGMATFYVGPPLGSLDVGPRGTLRDLVRILAEDARQERDSAFEYQDDGG